MMFNIKSLLPSKKALFLMFVGLMACGIAYGGYMYYQHYQSRLFRKAKALQEISEYTEAISVLKEHLIRNPKDLDAKIYLAQLYSTQGNHGKCLEILDRVYSEANKAGEQQMSRRVISLKRWDLATFANALNDSGTIKMKEGDLKKARELFQQAWDLWRKWMFSVALDTIEPATEADEWQFEFYISPLLSDIVLTYWLEGNYRQAKEELTNAFVITRSQDIRRKFPALVQKDFAGKLEELASKEFDKENYKLARIHWTEATECYSAASGYISFEDQTVPRLKYNCALTYFNEGDFQQGRKALSDLSMEFPDYQPQKIKEMLGGTKTVLFWQKEGAICRKAEKAFGEKRWSDVRVYCREAISYLLKSGIKEDEEEICRLNYNIAIAYYNDFKYKEAKEVFDKLQETKPNYNAEKVKELLAELREKDY